MRVKRSAASGDAALYFPTSTQNLPNMMNRFFAIQWHAWYLLTSMCLLCCSCHRTQETTNGTEEEQAYDLLLRKGQWAKIVEKNQIQPTESPACRNAVRLASWHMGTISREELAMCLIDSHGVLGSETSALMMSDIYMQLGMVNMARRAAFDAMVAMRSEKPNSRALKRLTEVALITQEYDLALKYISIGEENEDCRKWARQLKPLAEHPENIAQIPNFIKLREIYEKSQDEFFL